MKRNIQNRGITLVALVVTTRALAMAWPLAFVSETGENIAFRAPISWLKML